NCVGVGLVVVIYRFHYSDLCDNLNNSNRLRLSFSSLRDESRQQYDHSSPQGARRGLRRLWRRILGNFSPRFDSHDAPRRYGGVGFFGYDFYARGFGGPVSLQPRLRTSWSLTLLSLSRRHARPGRGHWAHHFRNLRHTHRHRPALFAMGVRIIENRV